MAQQITPPSVPVAKDFQSLQRSLVVAFGNLVAQLNQPNNDTFDVNNERITGVLDPATLLDAVPLGYLKRQLDNLNLSANGNAGIQMGTTTIITTQAVQISYT